MLIKKFNAAEAVIGEEPDALTQVNRSITEFTRLYFDNDKEIRDTLLQSIAALPEAEIQKLAASTLTQQSLVFAEHAVGRREVGVALTMGTADDDFNNHVRNPVNVLKGLFGEVAPVEGDHYRSVLIARMADFVREECDGDPEQAALLERRMAHILEGSDKTLKAYGQQDRSDLTGHFLEMMLTDDNGVMILGDHRPSRRSASPPPQQPGTPPV